MFENRPALVLNADWQPLSYFPLSLWHWEDAIKAVVKCTVNVVAEYDVVAHSPSVEIRLPSVVALKEYVPPAKRVPFTRFNLFLRDAFSCQYCGAAHRPAELTFDHVVPRSRGGHTTWQNIAAACSDCNTKKDAGTAIKPLRAPFEPTTHQLLAAQRRFPPKFLHETWVDHLFWDSELEKG